MQDRDGWLCAAMIELADTGDGEFDESVYVRTFAGRLAELLDPARVCALLLTDSGETAVGSDETATLLARLEADGTAGPCTSCYRTGRAILHLPLAAARSRWPVFTAAAEVAGLAACWALPMRRSQETSGPEAGKTIGAVSVLTTAGQAIAAADLQLARTLTELTTITIGRQRELRESQRLARQLQHALDSRVVIEQAKGAVSASLGITPGDAFGLLRSYARARSRPLPQLADDVVGGIVPADALLGGGSSSPRQSGQRRSGQRNPTCRALYCGYAGFGWPAPRPHQ